MAYQNLCYGLPPTNKLVVHILLAEFLLTAIFNSSLLNPGPNSNTSAHDINLNKGGLSFYYQNVQGLIPFTDLGKEHPNVDHTKIAELQQYVYTNSPDIVILNETWLKSTIHDEEILSSNSYKIFRRDRTIFTHPPDLDNPLKFRKNGGGVLIAISSSLQLSSKEISLKCKAEMLAVELMLNDNSKIVISTCYRVGTLGIPNFHEITRTLDILLRKKRLKNFFLIGDFNLRHANWETFSSLNNTEREPLTTADVTTANVTTANVSMADVTTVNVSTADVTTANVNTANVTTADMLVLGYGLRVRVWVMVRVRVWVRPYGLGDELWYGSGYGLGLGYGLGYGLGPTG